MRFLFRNSKKAKNLQVTEKIIEDAPPPPDELFAEYPLGLRYNLLFDFSGDILDKYSLDVYEKYRKVTSKLENIIVERNLRGKELEKAGSVDNAIELYEQNVTDMVDTPFPYDRLRIIYTRRKQYDDAIRVCKAYISAANERARVLNDPTHALTPNNKYKEWIAKLEVRKAKSG